MELCKIIEGLKLVWGGYNIVVYNYKERTIIEGLQLEGVRCNIGNYNYKQRTIT